MNKFWNEYPLVSEDLLAIKDILIKNMKSGDESINDILMDIVNSNGKMLRPAFVLIAGHLGEYDSEKLFNIAAVIEMLHMSTLIHDDIVDDSPLRRGNHTIQSKYGKNYAVFMGDYLFTKCFMMLSKTSSMESMKNISRVISEICIGEIRQFSSLFSLDLSVRKYLKRISGKTATLFALSFYIGASQSNCSVELCKTLGRVGYNLGMAFQIIDDILDYKGDPKTVGKPLGNDIKEGIFTLPLIYAYIANSKLVKDLLTNTKFETSDITEIIDLCSLLGGIDKSRSLAARYTKRAFDAIKCLPDCQSKATLLGVSEKLLLREY